MIQSTRPTGVSARPARAGALTMLCAAALLVAAPAMANLGGPRRSVEIDRAHLAAAMSSMTVATHVAHALATPNGGTVREYENGDGVVFAVAWHGPGRPDLRQLLGASFDTFQTSVTASRHGRMRRPLVVRSDDLVVHSAGHPGAFWGFAYLPRAVPAGFSPDALQ